MPDSSPENSPILPEKLEAFEAILAEKTKNGCGSKTAIFLNELAQKNKLADFMKRFETIARCTQDLDFDSSLKRLDGLLTREEKDLLDQVWKSRGYPEMGSGLSDPQKRLRNRYSLLGPPAGNLYGGIVYLMALLAAAGITLKTGGKLAYDGVKYGIDKHEQSHVQSIDEKAKGEETLKEDKTALDQDGKEFGLVAISAIIIGMCDWLRTKTKSDRDFRMFFSEFEEALDRQFETYKKAGQKTGRGERQ